MASNLDLVAACDSFPYDETSTNVYYKLFLPRDDQPVGYMLPSVVKKMPWTSEFKIQHEERTIKLLDASAGKDTSRACETVFQAVVDAIIDQNLFEIVHAQHSELIQIMSKNNSVKIERYVAPLFGIVGRGAHMTAYTNTSEGLKIWVARRSKKVFTYPNKLDTTVAGGIKAGDSPFETIVHEADEEASLPESLIREKLQSCGMITYIGVSGDDALGEKGLVVPDMIYVYDLELPEDVIPKPRDDEVEGFCLMGVDEVKRTLAASEYKTNSAVVMLDFFVRHGIITTENEEHYAEICTRLHRRLPALV